MQNCNYRVNKSVIKYPKSNLQMRPLGTDFPVDSTRTRTRAHHTHTRTPHTHPRAHTTMHIQKHTTHIHKRVCAHARAAGIFTYDVTMKTPQRRRVILYCPVAKVTCRHWHWFASSRKVVCSSSQYREYQFLEDSLRSLSSGGLRPTV